MKLRVIILLFILTGLIFTACRKEETEFVQAPQDERLVVNSNIASLIQNTVSNDGSLDNIVDRANCFDIVFPYTVNVNSEHVIVNSENDYATIECVFDQSEDDIDDLNIVFPVSIRLPDFTEIVIANNTELNNYTNTCNGENVVDNDIECIDFQYPIEASVFNSENELLETISIERDSQLYEFIDDIDVNDIITIDFPLTVVLHDGTEVIINNLPELEIVIENAENSCDEDDDYDYNEDDCDDCSTSEIENLLTSCTDWSVNTLRRDNNTNYDNLYYNYDFNFFNDGTLSVFWNTTTVYGTWVASGSDNNIEVIIDIPALPLCNNNWIVQEVRNCSVETEIDMRVGVDRIQYAKNCN
ncbi:hypothetical protein FBALC1_01032 [Flavobacteriales bacterium ALC-1]|nr:hypothetical protein FBALC1_01032 [Flavobacteriales bacterium ALC-1]